MDKQELEEIFNKIDWNDYKQFLINRDYSRHHINNMFYTARKHVYQVLRDPTYLSRLHWKTARHVLNAISVLQDYLDLKGVELIVNYKKLRKFLPSKKEVIDVFEYVDRFGGRLIDQAMEQLVFNKLLQRSRFYTIIALTVFYTGLRTSEIRYLIMNKSRLRTRFYRSVAIVELNYYRPHKNAVVTMLPKELYQLIPESYVGVLIGKRLRERGVYPSLMRKIHRNILSRSMDDAEIDLLQGRLGRIIVVHYTKHIYDIALKYEKAYQSYYKIINMMIKEEKPGGHNKSYNSPPTGLEPVTPGLTARCSTS